MKSKQYLHKHLHGRFFLSLLFYLFISLPQLWAQPFLTGISPGNGVVEYTISELAPLPGTDPDKHYRLFLDYGDGTYEKDIIKPTEIDGGGTVTKIYTHIYNEPPNQDLIRAELTEVYTPPSDDNLKYGTSSTQVPVSGSGNVIPDAGNFNGQFLQVDQSRSLRKGFETSFPITYIISDGSCPSWMGGILRITYGEGLQLHTSPSDNVSVKVETYHGETALNLPTTNSGSFDIQLPQITSSFDEGERRTVIINFTTPEETEVHQTTFQAELIVNQKSCGIHIEEPGILQYSEPYDPNFKTVSEDTISSHDPQWLYYFIQCQNTGVGPTDSITITDVLDDRLDPTTLDMLSVKMGYQEISNPDNNTNNISSPVNNASASSIPFMYELDRRDLSNTSDPDGQSLQWKLYNAGELLGTDQDSANFTIVERQTIAQIRYRIKTKYFEEYHVSIPNHAAVYFDSLAPIITDTALTHKFCCQERVDTQGVVTLNLVEYAEAVLPGIIDTSSITPISLTSDMVPNIPIPPSLGPVGLNGVVDYQPNLYQGIEKLLFSVMDNLGNIDTVCAAICVQMNPGQYPCDFATGLEQQLQENAKVKVYPNPTNDLLRIEHADGQIRSVGVYNLQGQRIWAKQQGFPTDQMTVQLGHLPDGIYFIRVNGEGVQRIQKM